MVPQEHDSSMPDSLGISRVQSAPTDPNNDSSIDENLNDDDLSSMGKTNVLDSSLLSSDLERESASRSGRGKRRKIKVLDDFILVRKLGQGSMATVFKAKQISFERTVALKLLHKHVADNPKLLERFNREALTMGQLDHPNIVQGYGVGEAEGFQYFAMEYIRGESLQTWLSRIDRIGVGDAIHITIACARALGYAHQQGIVHRDIKPDNVLITRDGKVKVADMGMVKVMEAMDEMSLTQTGHAVGTPWYMPLEQARNAKLTDGRSDIYALGCMLYCMLTGMPPFVGANIVEVIQAKTIGTFPTARSKNPEVPSKLDLIILKMTAKRPEDRYQTCEELVSNLESLNLANQELEFVSSNESSNSDMSAQAYLPTPLPSSEDTGIVENDEWYVRFKNDCGKTVLKKMRQGEITERVKAGELGPETKVSKHKESGYRTIATYSEFRSVALSLATKVNADRRTTAYRELYQQIDAQEETPEEPKDLSTNQIRHVILGVTVFLGILLVGGLIYLITLLFN